MQKNNFFLILLTNMRRNFLRSFVSSIGIIIGVASLYFFITIGSGLNHFIAGKEMQKLPINMLRIRATTLSLGPLSTSLPQMMKSSTISDSAIRRFARIKGVQNVYPVMNILFPISSRISFSRLFAGTKLQRRSFHSDLIMSGAPEKLVKDDIKVKNVRFTTASWPIPVLVSRRILDIYNSAFASGQNLPKISEKALLGFRLQLVLNQGTMVRQSNVRSMRVPCRVVGFTEKSEMLGLVMPLGYVKRYNKMFIRGWNQPKYSSVYIKAKSSTTVATIADSIEKMGYTVYAEKKLSNLILLVTLLLSLFSMIIIFVAAISIFNAFTVIVTQRTMEIGLFRSFGATKFFIKRLFLSEAGIVGAITGLLGLMLGIFLVRLSWQLIQSFLPPFLKNLGSIFPFSTPLFLILLGGSILTSLLATFVPATIASRLEISSALRR